MSVKEISFEALTEKWTKTVGSKYLYINKDLNKHKHGIDYEHFIGLRFDSINEQHIAKIYGIDGWFLLWNLMCQAKSNECSFLETTINMIYEKINKKITSDNIKKLLIEFNRHEIIRLNRVKDINVNTPLQIFIAYNNDYYPFKEKKGKGYKALPIDFVKAVLNNVTPAQWAVFTVLCVRYRYWQTVPKPDAYGNMYYNLFKEHYAYPTMEQIGDIIGRKKSQVGEYISSLANNTLEIIKVYESNKNEMVQIFDEEGIYKGNKRKNYVYYIPLFERVEWIYQHVILQDNRDKKTKKDNKENFEDIAMTKDFECLKDTDYLMSSFETNINEYEKALKNNDDELYQSCERKCEHQNGITNVPQSNQDNVVEVDFKEKIV